MARTPSVMIDLGIQAPEFSLPEPLTGKNISLSDYANKPILIAFISNHCPYVIKIKEIFSSFARQYMQKDVAIIAINANDVANYPDDSPEKMVEDVKNFNYSFPYLYDETQAIAKAYQAACTPDFYLFDSEHKLYYRGQFDSARPGNNIPATGEDMIAAIEGLLENQPAPKKQLASLGCNIKWKQGNEPNYF